MGIVPEAASGESGPTFPDLQWCQLEEEEVEAEQHPTAPVMKQLMMKML